MAPDSRHVLKTLLHPYIFVLKEGRKINNDFLDYSLMMLHIISRETIKSPRYRKLTNSSTVQEEILKQLKDPF